jgi:mannitol-1-phosphate 5-dehydrogenase
MSVFLGIGLGPIQTGIFLSGAEKGGIKRKVIAEVDSKLRDAINNDGGKVSINIAGKDKIYPETINGVEVYSPVDANEIEKLIDAAAEADEIATALPSVKFFAQVAEWLRKGFQKNPDKYRIIYTAENDNHAAEKFQEAIGVNFKNTHYLNTVVGKMSGVVPAADCKTRSLLPLSPNADRGHLVEEFNKIFISNAPGVENRKVKNLHVKDDLYPFEEAKLYGHNAIHLLLALLGKKEGKAYMSDLKDCTKLLEFARTAFINESGKALCKKWAGVDELFTEKGFKAYADDLIERMTNPFLTDAIERISRDLARKLSWNDRVVGTMRVVLGQGIKPSNIAYGAVLGSIEQFGDDIEKIRKGLAELWPAPWDSEHDEVFAMIDKIYKEKRK